MNLDYNNLLNSSGFLNYPELSKEVFKGMNNPSVKIILKKDYTKNTLNLFNRIIFCFNSIIHKLYNNLSVSYSANFERIKADVLKKNGLDLDYFLHSNAFLNLPEISKLVFDLIKQPNFKFLVPKQQNNVPDDSFMNRIYFVYSSIQHNLWLTFSSSYCNKFKTAATKVSDAITSKINKQTDKIKKQKEKEDKKDKLKENNFVKSTNEKYLEINLKQEEFKNTKVSTEKLAEQIELITKKTSPEHLDIEKKGKEKDHIKLEISKNEKKMDALTSEISNLDKEISNLHEGVNGLKSDQSNSFLNIFKNEEGKTQLANNIKAQEASLEIKKNNLTEKTTELNTLISSTKVLKKEFNKIPKKIKNIEIKIDEKLKSSKQEHAEKTKRLNLLTNFLNDLQNDFKEHLLEDENKSLYDSLVKRDKPAFSEPEMVFINELINGKTKETDTKTETKKPETPENKPEKKIDLPLKPEIIKTAACCIVEKFKQFNPKLSTILESFLSRFNEKDILSFDEKDGNFSIKLQKTLKLWVSRTTDADPEGGSILLFGMQTLVEGKINEKNIQFTNGFEVYCKSNWPLGLLTANVYSFSEKNQDQFDLTAGKIGFTKSETLSIADTINKWKSPKLAEVVVGDHVHFLNEKLVKVAF